MFITKFNGTHLDWFRFWNQFESDIEKSELTPVSKCFCLKRLVFPKVWSLIDGFPFTIEGYDRAKNVLVKNYGKRSEVTNAHVKSIMSLPHISNSNPYKIHEFSEKLLSSVQARETIGKLKEINGYVILTLDKLQGIRADLVRTDDDLQDWKFSQLVEALENWTCRNPKPLNHKPLSEDNRANRYRNPNKIYQANQHQIDSTSCKKSDHKTADLQTVKTTSERRKLLSEKKLCFNCTKLKHRAADCRSSKTCLICKNKHHTSICAKSLSRSTEALITTTKNNVIYPVSMAKINGVKCCALIYLSSWSSYASEGLLDYLKINPTKKEIKTIETLTKLTTKKLKICSVKIQDLNETCIFNTDLNKLEREVLLTLPNPKYSKILKKYPHLKDVHMNDTDEKEQLPVHIILGASDFAKIKFEKSPRARKIGKLFAELTKTGWPMMFPGRESDVVSPLYKQISISDYQKLCSNDFWV